jgi:hypothetical protein
MSVGTVNDFQLKVERIIVNLLLLVRLVHKIQ